MNSIDLAFTPALELARLIRSGEISPLELTELYLKRIAALDGQLGSFVVVAAEQAIADARLRTEQLTKTEQLTQSEPLPPFFGVPIAIKDLNSVAGLPCAYGVKLLKNRLATEDEGVVQRLRQAGFVILGKTATSEAGTLPYTEPKGQPPTRNPWHLDYTPGGSSGGSAAAVAAGLIPIAHGSDGGGSVRGPASCCGLVGIKPSRGRISLAPFGDRLSGIATSGPIARTVADAAAMLDAMAGYTTGDPYWLPDPTPSFLTAAQTPSPRLRIAYSTEMPPIGVADPICRQAVLDTAQLLERMGHAVEPGSPNYEGLEEPFTIIWQSVLGEAGIPGFFLGRMNRWLLRRARSCSSGQYLRAVSAMHKVSRRIVAFFDKVDVLLLPVYLHPTIRVGEWAKLPPARTMEKIIHWVAPCPPFNATGQPAIALPTGFAPNGLPIGVQLVGRPAAEATLISLAAALEVAQPWSQQRPAFAILP
ncbi:MAG TPA: amidase [Thermosynechococcaceae cyanobacterium]